MLPEPPQTMAPPEEILKLLNKDALLQVASSLSGGLSCHFLGDPVAHSSYTILVIEFLLEHKLWAARISEDQEYSFLEISLIPLGYIARNFPNIPAPRVHGYFDAGAKGKNPVGVAYMPLDWIEGKPMPPWSLTGPPCLTRKKLLRQLARMMFEMLSTPAKDDITFYGKSLT